MACLFQRSNGIFYLVGMYRGRRVWRSTGMKNRADAEIVSRTDFPQMMKSNRVPMFQDFTVGFLAHARANLAPSTVGTYNRAITSFLSEMGNRRLDLYSPRDVEQFKVQRVSRVSPVTVNIEFRCLKALFQTGVRWELIKRNPFAGVGQFRIHLRTVQFLTQEEFQILLDAITYPWYKDLVRFAVSTMMRAGEIVNLGWSSVDLNRRVVLVESTARHTLKTGRSHAVPMNDWVFAFLSYQTNRTGLVFRFTDGRSLNVGYISGLFRRFLRRTELSHEFSFHSLRHTGASWLVQSGATLYEVQQLLGHTSASTTQIYAHLSASALHDTVNRINIR
jgi:integrase